jgi:hypothetical protein
MHKFVQTSTPATKTFPGDNVMHAVSRFTTLLSFVLLFSLVNEVLGDYRVHSGGNIRMTVTNRGLFGNPTTGPDDPEHPGEWARSCEFPAGSGAEYLYQGTLWIGALIQEEGYEYPRVSVGWDGWVNPGPHEFFAYPDSFIRERSNIEGAQDYLGNDIYSPEAVATQEFLCDYSDTLTEPFWVAPDPIDSLHQPLGIKISQKSMVWEEAEISDFIIIEWVVENIGELNLKNVYIGFYIDSDVGSAARENTWYEDDLTGFIPWRYFESENGIDSVRANMAYIADNDGRPREVAQGNDFTAPGVSGVILLDSPNPRINTSYNWWMSNGDRDLDYGPGWADDNSPGDWTRDYGTPMGDVRKYFLMQNREQDFDAIHTNSPEYIMSHPQLFIDPRTGDTLESHDWRVPQDDDLPHNCAGDISSGFDAKYLMSWGPLGIFDHQDEAGNRIYRLDPGESFTITVAYICAEGFHDRNNPQPDNEVIDPGRFDFSDLYRNIAAAQVTYNRWLTVTGDHPFISVPRLLSLSPAFPSPFNSSAFVDFATPFAGQIRASLVDLNGREWTKWTVSQAEPGVGRFVINGGGLASGQYWLKVEQGGRMAGTRVVMVK